MIAEILTIGNEVLSGRTLDTNFPFLSRLLEESGARVLHHQTVGDQPEAIAVALKTALGRAHVVILTGGLGPTPDDLTRKAVAQALNRPLSLDAEVLEGLRRRWRERGGRSPMPPANELQALVPRGAQVLPNPVGSAPGLLIEAGEQAVFVLPGVPLEMEAMARASVASWVRERAGRPIEYLTLRTVGIWESVLAERLRDLTATLPGCAVAFLPGHGGVDVRVLLPSPDAQRMRERARALLLERVGHYVYAEGEDTLEAAVGKLLVERGYWVGVAESCTGGLLSGRLTAVSGSSKYFERGVVCYSDAAKIELVGVPRKLIESYGAVSEPVARALARGAAKLAAEKPRKPARAAAKRGSARSGAPARGRSLVGLGVTGVAGPTGGSLEKPVGTVHVACIAPEGERHRLLALSGSRSMIRERSVVAALDLLRRLLLGLPESPKQD